MAWLYVWIIIVVGSLAVEFLTDKVVALWFAVGAIIAMIISAFAVVWWVQILAFTLVSVPSLIFLRKFALKLLKKEE